MRQKGKIWINQEGKEVPSKIVSNVLKLEEKHSQKIAVTAEKAQKYLQEVVEQVYAAYEEIINEKMIRANAKDKKIEFNGLTFHSFDGDIEIKVTKPMPAYFDKSYSQMVSDKFNEYFDAISKTDNQVVSFLKDIIVDLIFSGKTLDQKQVNILRDKRNDLIESKQAKGPNLIFIEAVEMFDQAIRRKKGNTGIYVSVRNPKTGKMERVALKYSDL